MKRNRPSSALRRPTGGILLGLFALLAIAFTASAVPTQEVKHGIGQWDPESGLGNHRAVVRVSTLPAPKPLPTARGAKKAVPAPTLTKSAAVRVIIPWRRRDLEPERNNIAVVDATSGERITNVLALAVNREYGDILFEPKTVPCDYYIYFMPYRSEGRKNYPNVKYDPPSATADTGWLAANGLTPDKLPALRPDAFPRAEVVELQSADEFSAFTPMELIATAAEIGRAHV